MILCSPGDARTLEAKNSHVTFQSCFSVRHKASPLYVPQMMSPADQAGSWVASLLAADLKAILLPSAAGTTLRSPVRAGPHEWRPVLPRCTFVLTSDLHTGLPPDALPMVLCGKHLSHRGTIYAQIKQTNSSLLVSHLVFVPCSSDRSFRALRTTRLGFCAANSCCEFLCAFGCFGATRIQAYSCNRTLLATSQCAIG